MPKHIITVEIDEMNYLIAAIHKLGLNDACTAQGAIELLAGEIREGSVRIAGALDNIASAITAHIK